MSGSTGDPDMALIGELLEEITRHPPANGARKLLVEHYISVGWLDAAMDNTKELRSLAPNDPDVLNFLNILDRKPEPPAREEKKAVAAPPKIASESRTWDPKTGRYKKNDSKLAKKLEAVTLMPDKDLEPSRQDLSNGYQALRTRARYVIADLLHLQALQKKAGFVPSKNTARIQSLAEGRKLDISARTGPPGSTQSLARSIKAKPADTAELVICDLEATMRWLREPHGESTGADDDAVRDALVKRKNALESTLPDNLKLQCDIALMHVEHENLGRNYANTETMLGDEVKDISRANFLVTEDNYAWDMEELVQAITVGQGIMRNPLSKEMFTPKDVKCILLHPLGKPLAALAVQQHELSKGVRAQTIDQMEKLSNVLLEDQSSDALASRKAVDEFLAYVATLPDLEQQAIERLKCPAKDSHTGQAYDFSILEAVKDAAANRVCFHKSGDFIKQAAAHLRRNRGVAPDPNSCITM